MLKLNSIGMESEIVGDGEILIGLDTGCLDPQLGICSICKKARHWLFVKFSIMLI